MVKNMKWFRFFFCCCSFSFSFNKYSIRVYDYRDWSGPCGSGLWVKLLDVRACMRVRAPVYAPHLKWLKRNKRDHFDSFAVFLVWLNRHGPAMRQMNDTHSLFAVVNWRPVRNEMTYTTVHLR